MIKFGAVPHSDSVLLSAIAVARILRAAGHEFRVALDESAASYGLLKTIAKQLNEDIVPLDVLSKEKPDAVFFESSSIAPHAFADVFRINFLPGLFQNQRYFLFRMNAFFLGNFVFSPNYIAPYILDVCNKNIPVLGIPSANLFPTVCEKKQIVFPDSFPMTDKGRRVWFSILERIARVNPEYSLVIKERFSKDFFGHVPFPSFSKYFSAETPSSISIADCNTDTRELLAQSSYILGVNSGMLVEAALNNKKVCLIEAEYFEKPLGRSLGDDWFREQGLRVSPEQAIQGLDDSCLLTPESLDNYIPNSFLCDWFVEALEGIFTVFPDSDLRNSLAFPLDQGCPLEGQLVDIRDKSETAEEEREKNLIRYEVAHTISQAAMMINLIAPDIDTSKMANLIKKYISYEMSASCVNEARNCLQERMKSLADEVTVDYYSSEKLDYILAPEMLYETPYLIPGFFVANSLKRLGNEVEEKRFSKKLYKMVAAKEENTLASYVNAVSLKRMGSIKHSKEIFEKLIKNNKVEKNIKSGAFFHLGDIAMNEEEHDVASDLFCKCLEVEPKHGKAREFLDQLSGNSCEK